MCKHVGSLRFPAARDGSCSRRVNKAPQTFCSGNPERIYLPRQTDAPFFITCGGRLGVCSCLPVTATLQSRVTAWRLRNNGSLLPLLPLRKRCRAASRSPLPKIRVISTACYSRSCYARSCHAHRKKINDLPLFIIYQGLCPCVGRVEFIRHKGHALDTLVLATGR